ncbi:glycosyltransferase family 4 protein [Oceaniglobus roseus]|uniref:glycosyltransferase family 4 protein n=1 Tax=Oceaniglobus roseus TaxID=1737570 RepID=UPI00130011BD|nr:glycosyltransferase family 4 protein [Kandeliimicrobium roseum]
MSGGVTFIDPMAPRPYTGLPGDLAGLGGTEMTLVRICEALSRRLPITVRQSARPGSVISSAGVRYEGFDPKRPLPERPAAIIVVNSWKVAAKVARLHPGTRIILWLHGFPGRHNRGLATAMAGAGIEIVCVSASHARWLRDFCGAEEQRIRHLHNPIAEALAPDGTPRDPNLLLFASSPHKGLDQVFRRFETLRTRLPDLRLAVADPGYLAWPTGPVPEGVIPIGRLGQAALIRWMRRALCLFYPQDRFAETFGLVIAEANAVGCPALLHRGLGANDEVASCPSQCIDTTDPAAIAARIAEWRAAPDHRPLAQARPEFRLSRVVEDWAALLGAAPADAPELERLSD